MAFQQAQDGNVEVFLMKIGMERDRGNSCFVSG